MTLLSRPLARLGVGLASLVLAACGGESPTPAAPDVDAFPALTNESPITLTGEAEPGAQVQVRGGEGAPASGTAGADGSFSVEVALQANADNTLLVSQLVDDVESAATTVTVEHDGTAPSAPDLDPVITPTRRATQTLRGETEAGATVRVTGGAEDAEVIADASGRFTVEVALEESATVAVVNELNVAAEDLAGNVGIAATATITFDPDLAIEAPVLDAFPTITNAATVTLAGDAEPGAGISAMGGASDASATVDAAGRFSVEVALSANAENTIRVLALADDATSPAATAVVMHDDIAPDAAVLDPVTTPTRYTTQTLRGAGEIGATVVVTGGAASAEGLVDGDGRFSVEVTLLSGSTATESPLSVVVRDPAGNLSTAANATITVDPALALEAPVLDAFPPFTNDDVLTLTGTAEAGAAISAVGGGTDDTATAGIDGRFSVEIGLRPNQRNELRFFAVAGGDTSPAASAIVFHDDVAPEAPALDPQASPTGAASVTLVGTAEANTTIAITGGAAAAGGPVDTEGRFSIDLGLTLDADNDVSVIATDAAGNDSAATTLRITQDSSLEQPVTVNPVSSPTSDASVMLSGTATASVTIEITGGVALVSTTSNGAGAWMATVALRANELNELHIARPGSGVETIVTIVHDDIAPNAPSLNALPSPTGETSIQVSGTSEPLARISISGATAAASGTAEADGRFTIAVTLAADATTNLSVIATDRAGNSSSPTTASVTHSSSVPDAPIVDQATPPATRFPTHTVTGRVTAPGAGIGIRITGGMAAATGTTNPTTGAFSVVVTLSPNVVNSLSVVSEMGAITSPATVVTITHDDIAPTAPVAGSLSATGGLCVGVPVGGTVAGAGGAVEARASVRVQNVTRGTSATTTATDGGAFNASLASCTGNVIRVTASDAAGNVSSATEINAS